MPYLLDSSAIEVSRVKYVSLARFSLLVPRETAMSTGVTIAMISHEVAWSTSLADGKQPLKLLFINFVMRENSSSSFFGLFFSCFFSFFFSHLDFLLLLFRFFRFFWSL